MNDISYGNLYNIIQPSLPESWLKIIIRAYYVEDSCNIKYYIKQPDKEYCDCFQLCSDPYSLLQILSDLQCEISNVRNQLTPKNKWNEVTVIIDCEGNFTSDFNYSKITDESPAAENVWKEKFMKK